MVNTVNHTNTSTNVDTNTNTKRGQRRQSNPSSKCGRFPKFHRVFLGRDPGTLKPDIMSKNIHN